jgi:FHA domain-containing protein
MPTMTLTLRAVSLNDHPLTQPITAHFDAEGGSIGRADHNTLALPSPERHISRQQAEIRCSAGRYAIRNVGSANPIIVRGQALARGESAPLAHQDQVRIGGYLLEVVQQLAADDEADSVVRGRAAVDAATPGVTRRALAPTTGPLPGAARGGLGELGAPLSRDNPFADLLGAPDDAAMAPYATPMPTPAAVAPAAPAPLLDPFGDAPPAAGIPASSGAWAPPPTPTRQLLPDDFDPFAPPAAPPPANAPPSGDTHLFEGLVPGGPAVSLDQAFGLGTASARDPLSDFMADLAPVPRAPMHEDRTPAGTVPVDPLAALGLAATAPPSTAPTMPDHVPALHGAYRPPPVQRDDTPARSSAHPPTPAPMPTPTRRAEPAAPAGPAWAGDAQALWAAFCEGAGVAVVPPHGVDAALMRHVGALMQAAVAGTLQLMSVRATARHELRAQVTVIQAQHNNPLKFSPDARSALEQLLQPPLRGFLPGPEAMTDAMHDLVGHTIGTMAGTRAALEGVLDRFTPQQLEAKLAGHSVLDSVLPMHRKARLWELYLQNFEAIRNEAQDDFHSLFGRAFLEAYEQQLARLQAHDQPLRAP